MFRRLSRTDEFESLGFVQYVGNEGISADCYDAIKRFVQFGDRIGHIRLLTAGNYHAFQFSIDEKAVTFVRSGFSSGYSGEGPRVLAQALMLLEQLRPEMVEEVVVTEDLLSRLNNARLTQKDLALIEKNPPVRPYRIHEYVYPYRAHSTGEREIKSLPVVMPWSIIDERLLQSALDFERDPDQSIFSGFRALEDIIRQRTGIHEHGLKLFAQAFANDSGPLYWKCQDAAEEKGRAQLFASIYMAYRNPRAHRSPGGSMQKSLAEFLLLNQLFRLEQEAQSR